MNSIKLIKQYFLAWSTVILILGALLIVSVTAVQMYQTYTTNNLQKQVAQLCTDSGGYVTFSTTTGYSGQIRATKNMAELIPGSSNNSRLRCTPSGSSYINLPNGHTIIPNSVIDDEHGSSILLD